MDGLNDPDGVRALYGYFGAIVLDLTFLFHWQVAKLPAPYDAMENAIVRSVIGVAGIAQTVRRIFGKLLLTLPQ